MIGHYSHQDELHNPRLLLDAADKLCKQIATHAPAARFVVVRGISGAAMGGLVSALSGLVLVIVRKPDDNAHSKISVQTVSLFGSTIDDGHYVIVDDLIDSGATIDAIVKVLRGESAKTVCDGIFLYHGHSLYRQNMYRDIPVYDEKEVLL